MGKVKSVTNERLFEMMYSELTKKQDEMSIKYDAMLKTQNVMLTSQDEMKGSIQKNTDGILRIELVHGKKIDLLLDGYKSHEEKLDYVIQELSANNAKCDR